MLYPVELRAHAWPTLTPAPYKARLSSPSTLGRRLSVRAPKLLLKIGRGREIRTPDILLPKQARYQTALYPDTAWMLPLECWLSNRKAFLPEMRSRRPQILLNLCDQRQRHCTNIAQAVII